MAKKRTNDIPLPDSGENIGAWKSMNAFERRQMIRQGAPDAMKGRDIRLPNESGKTDPRVAADHAPDMDKLRRYLLSLKTSR